MFTFTQQQVKTKVEEFRENQFSKAAQNMEDANEILDYCIKKAWVDATQRERFKGQKSKIIQNKEKIIENFKQRIAKREFSSNYDTWHQKMCSKTEYDMTYGIWQKLINMTFKYMYCRRVKFPDIDFSQCHCPIDSVIAQRAVTLGIICKVEPSGEIVSIARSGQTNWNNMKQTDYEKVQKKIKEIKNKFRIIDSDTEHPTDLEFDFLFW